MQWLTGALVLAIGIVVMMILIVISRDSPIGLTLGMLAGIVGFACWAAPYAKLDRLGVRMRADLEAAGIRTHRRPPLHSPYLYGKWLTRNNLSGDRVSAALE